jgi:hypothetical protein
VLKVSSIYVLNKVILLSASLNLIESVPCIETLLLWKFKEFSKTTILVGDKVGELKEILCGVALAPMFYFKITTKK